MQNKAWSPRLLPLDDLAAHILQFNFANPPPSRLLPFFVIRRKGGLWSTITSSHCFPPLKIFLVETRSFFFTSLADNTGVVSRAGAGCNTSFGLIMFFFFLLFFLFFMFLTCPMHETFGDAGSCCWKLKFLGCLWASSGIIDTMGLPNPFLPAAGLSSGDKGRSFGQGCQNLAFHFRWSLMVSPHYLSFSKAS